MVILGRLRAWPLLLWMALMFAICGYSIWLEWSGEGFSDSIYYHLFGPLLGPLMIGISLFGMLYVFGMWRRRIDYLRHDRERIFRGGRKSWPLQDIQDVVLVDKPLGKRAVRIVTARGKQEYLTDSFYFVGSVADLRSNILRAVKAARGE